MAASEFKSQALQKLTAGTVPIKLVVWVNLVNVSLLLLLGVYFQMNQLSLAFFFGGEFLQPCEVVPLVGSLSGQLQAVPTMRPWILKLDDVVN